MYGVERFPYRSRRKHQSCLHQTFEDRIVIHNDIFGLTIKQFNREFEKCLLRRERNEQYILNVRFPNKISSDYLEYLENATIGRCETNTGQLSTEDQVVCMSLMKIIGSEKVIRTRQKMFHIQELLLSSPHITNVPSGSLAEGFDLDGSDVDTIVIFNEIEIVQDFGQHSSSRLSECLYTVFSMEGDINHPGFTKLKLASANYIIGSMIPTICLIKTDSGTYLSSTIFLDQVMKHFYNIKLSQHGPCLSDTELYSDFAICLKMKKWPQIARRWVYRRRRGQWPSDTLINKITSDGCLLVPIGPKYEDNTELFWRISFSLAEKQLSYSFNYTQLLCYGFLKLTLKNCINKNEEVQELLCSYFLKTAVFWVSEESSIELFKVDNLVQCYWLCIDKLISWVAISYCPNYFIPEHNMFRSKIDNTNNQKILEMLQMMRSTGLRCITPHVFKGYEFLGDIPTHVSHDETNTKLEFLFYRVIECYYIQNIQHGCKMLQLIDYFLQHESSQFMLGVCRYYHATISRQISQMLTWPKDRRRKYRIQRLCQKRLQDGTKSDAVSGWLLYASYYYVRGQYKATLEIVDHVLSRCTPDMVMLRMNSYAPQIQTAYNQITTCRGLTLNEKMRLATVDDVYYVKHSSLIPHELQLEVQDHILVVPPAVMSHFLKFLCYHHLNDVSNKLQSYMQLILSTNDMQYISKNFVSITLVILGVCNEIFGNKHEALTCYDMATKCDIEVCKTAELRHDNLLRCWNKVT